MGIFDTAVSLGSQIAAQTRTSVAICQDYIDRIALKNPLVNAIVSQRQTYDILADASLADARALSGTRLSPLDGVPFTLKASLATQGVRTTNSDGSVNVTSPLTDSDIAKKLKAAGCILLGKTNGPGGPIHTTTTLFGETKNPHNLLYPTGGSSGGSAAAVAAGFSAFDVGVDSAGSIRIPASFCGVYGLKPTNGAVSGDGDWSGGMPSRPPFHTIDLYSYGPITRSLDDLEAVLSIIAGPTPARPHAAPLPASSNPTLAKLVKITSIGPWYCSPFVQNAIDSLLSAQSGVTVVSATAPFFDGTAFNNIYNGLSNDPAQACAGYPLNETPWTPAGLNYATIASRNAQASVHALYLAQQIEALMGDADALILGTTALSPVAIGQTDPAAIAYMAMTALFCIAGNPAVTIPLGFDPSTGVAFGVQLVGRHWRDLDLLAIAGQLAGTPGVQQPTI